MVNNSIITLENQKEYGIIDTIKKDSKTYIYLTNIKDIEDFCIRKEIIEDEETILVGLDNEEEVDLALTLFAEKHINDESNT